MLAVPMGAADAVAEMVNQPEAFVLFVVVQATVGGALV